MENHPTDGIRSRQEAVARLGIVGSPPEPSYDRLVRLAATLLDVPIAVISVLDADRSWFKARVGLDVAETPIDLSFCARTVDAEPGEPFVLADTWLDDRFADHPLVIGAPRIRFYAGIPLRAPGGAAVGTLAVIDRVPRELRPRERQALSDLASIVEDLFASRQEPVGATTGADAPADGPDLYRALFDHVSDVVVVMDEQAQVKFASPSFERLLGHPIDFRHSTGALALVHPDDRALARAEITAVMAGSGSSEPFALRVLTATGSIRNVECTAASLFDTPVGGVVVSLRDVSDRHLLSQMLSFQSTHDRLTELPNRMLFLEHLVPALARAAREHREIAVCSLDLDGFQELNDQLGYAAGDELLVDVARRLRSSIRTGDSAARIGGDEFCVLLDPVASAEDAMSVARRLVDAVSGPHSLQTGVSSCGASGGVAVSMPGDDATAIIARAGRALANAKRGGAGTVVAASEAVSPRSAS